MQQTFKRWTLYEDSRPQQKFKDERFTEDRITLAPQQMRLKDEHRVTHESPRELGRQSEAKRKQALQSEANVSRHKCNLKKSRLLIAQNT